MPLPDEKPRQSVANLIGRFELQGKRSTSSTNSPTTPSLLSPSKSLPGTPETTPKVSQLLEKSEEMPSSTTKPKEEVAKQGVPTQTVSKAKPSPRQSLLPSSRNAKTKTASVPSTTTKSTDLPNPRSLGRTIPARTSTGHPPAAIKAQHTGSSVGVGKALGTSKVSKVAPATSVPAPPRAKTPSASQSRLYAPTAASLARSTGGTETKPRITTASMRPHPKTTIPTPISTRATQISSARPKTPSSRTAPLPATAASARARVSTVSSPPIKSVKTRANPSETRKRAISSSQSVKSALTEVPAQASQVAGVDTSFTSEFMGHITHLSSHSQDAQIIENYDDDFPETDVEPPIEPGVVHSNGTTPVQEAVPTQKTTAEENSLSDTAESGKKSSKEGLEEIDGSKDIVSVSKLKNLVALAAEVPPVTKDAVTVVEPAEVLNSEHVDGIFTNSLSGEEHGQDNASVEITFAREEPSSSQIDAIIIDSPARKQAIENIGEREKREESREEVKANQEGVAADCSSSSFRDSNDPNTTVEDEYNLSNKSIEDTVDSEDVSTNGPFEVPQAISESEPNEGVSVPSELEERGNIINDDNVGSDANLHEANDLITTSSDDSRAENLVLGARSDKDSTTLSSPDLEDGVRMLEGASVSVDANTVPNIPDEV